MFLPADLFTTARISQDKCQAIISIQLSFILRIYLKPDWIKNLPNCLSINHWWEQHKCWLFNLQLITQLCEIENLTLKEISRTALFWGRSTWFLTPVTYTASAPHRNIRGWWGQQIWIVHGLRMYKLTVSRNKVNF